MADIKTEPVWGLADQLGINVPAGFFKTREEAEKELASYRYGYRVVYAVINWDSKQGL